MYSIVIFINCLLEFTPLEFETTRKMELHKRARDIRIYSVGVWNLVDLSHYPSCFFIRIYSVGVWNLLCLCLKLKSLILEFTPLEFETQKKKSAYTPFDIRIYSVGVWNMWVANPLPLISIRIYSVGVWNINLQKRWRQTRKIRIYSVGVWNPALQIR